MLQQSIEPKEYNDSNSNVVPLKTIPFTHMRFYAAIECFWEVFFDMRDNFMKANFKANFFLSFPVENSVRNKDMIRKELTQK